MGLLCLYCVDPDHDSVSHIIPEFLGQGPTLKSGVCNKCNNALNHQVEQNVVPKFHNIRALLGLPKKRGNESPQMRLVARLGEATFPLSAKTQAEIDGRVFVFKNPELPDGNKGTIAFISGDDDALAEKKNEFAKNHPEIPWKEIDPNMIDENLVVEMEIDYGVFAEDYMRRVAAKIAIEWWAYRRSPDICVNQDFHQIAEFVMKGSGTGASRVEIVTNAAIYSSLANVPFGNHVIYELLDHRTKRLTIIFGLFAWIYYKVVLSRDYALATEEGVTLVNPQNGICYSPKIVRKISNNLKILATCDYGQQTQEEVFEKIGDTVLNRLNAAFPED